MLHSRRQFFIASLSTVVGCGAPLRHFPFDQGEPGDHAQRGLLIDLYGVTMNEVLRREAVHVDLVPRFRKLGAQVEVGVDEAISLLNDFVTAEVELETLLGVERPSNLPPERPLLPGDVRKQAEADARELRERMGLGQGPIRNVFSLLELDLGIRIYGHPLRNHVSGLFAYDDDVGACILVNSNHRYERQVATIIHELGHTVSARFARGVYVPAGGTGECGRLDGVVAAIDRA